MTRVLVLGGARSGKSVTAERMLSGGPADYLATGRPPQSGDPEWDARIRAHRERRPATWRTFETLDVAGALARPDPTPVLVDCVGTWLARVMDACGCWDRRAGADAALAARRAELVRAWRETGRQVVVVSNEVGADVPPETESGRRFRDELGALNGCLAEHSDEIWLCTAGIGRRLR